MDKLFLKESKNLTLKNLLLKSRISLLLTILILLTSNSINAQMECRSMIGAHLKPITKKIPISWAIEGTMAPGIMTSPYENIENAKLTGGMLLGALEINFAKKNHIYIEGGYKNWLNSALVNDKKLKSRHFGVRQFFTSYSDEDLKVKVGLHETRMGEFFLVDERILGGSIDKGFGAFNINVRGGTVLKNFARMGQFCSNRHLYGVIHSNYTERIGEKIGETNLAGLVVNWDPNYKSENGNGVSGDEFSETTDEFSNTNDEFHENHDFNEFSNNEDEFDEEENNTPFVTLKNIGLILYDEFGSNDYIPNNKFYIGSLFDLEFRKNIFLQVGPVYQNMANNNTLVYIAKLGRSVTWENASNTKFSAAYIGKYDIDENALFQPLFSNLFLGEIMRMDAVDFPLWQVAIKHRFPGEIKFRLAIKAVGQIEDAKTNEQNLEAGILVFDNHLKVTLVGSHVTTEALPKDFYTVRLETRLAF